MKKLFLLIFVSILAASTTLSAQTAEPFQAGDKVVLMGDSITHGGHYHSYVWLYYMTRFPDMRIDLINAGMGGECSWDMAARFDADVLDRKPTYVTLTFGMNDTGYADLMKYPDGKQQYDEKVAKSLASFHEMEEKLAKADFKVAMIGGSPYDETTKFTRHHATGKHYSMGKIIDEQKAAAERHGWGFIDFHQPMIDISLREQAKDSTFSFCRLERVHPDNDGQMVMAYLFLKAQGLAGKKVADISIDANGKVRTSENCVLSNIEKGKDGISFDYLANSLPYPVDSISQNGWANKRSQKDALELVPFTEEFNQEILRVNKLKEGSYALYIDGEKITETTAAELGEGLNLALYNTTPQYRQASAIMYLNEERLMVERRLVEYLWVEYEYLRKAGMMFQDDEAALEYLREICKKDMFLGFSFSWYKQAMNPTIRQTWSDYKDKLTDTIYSMNKPVSHRISIEKL